jgi:hypothetical protein
MTRITGIELGALVGLLGLAIVIGTTRSSAQQPTCLHDANEQPDQAARRQRALGFTRHINTLQASAFGSSKAYQPAERLTLAQSLPAGFILRLTAADASYAFSVLDTTDPCRFGYFSDDRGVIFRGEAIR